METDPRAKQLREALAAYNLDAQSINRFATMPVDELRQTLRTAEYPAQINGLLAIIEILLTQNDPSQQQISSPADAGRIGMVTMSHLDQEEVRVISLDVKNRVLGYSTVYRGSVDSAIVRVGELYKEAIRLNARSIIALHNHPSGDAEPSPQDAMITRTIVDAGRILDVECSDHIIIGKGKYVSLRERHIGFLT